jgi:cold shock CspA family protein
MGKSQETFNKKEKEKKKKKKQQEKENRKEERKANSDKGKSFEDMLAYVDEFGNISATPIDPKNRIEIATEDIQIGVARKVESEEDNAVRKGIVNFFNDSKGFGFIKDSSNGESVFVHINDIIDKIKEGDKVEFDTEMGHKGLKAIKVKKI